MRIAMIGLVIVLCGLLGACSQVEKGKEIGLSHGPLVSASELDSMLQLPAPSISLIDIRLEEEYLAGHIPGAVNVWRPSLADDRFPYSSITAPKEKLEELFARIGVMENGPIVVYDGKMSADAANLWWIFNVHGRKDVKILEGGLLAWKGAGLPLNTDSVMLPSTQFRFPAKGDSSHYASLETVRRALGDPNTILIDTRSFEEYTGETVKDGAKKGGHIPGSIWLNYSDATIETQGCVYLKPRAELETLFKGKGITSDKHIICYCHSGVRSAHTTFVLTELLGYPNVKNFDGSWEEWSQQDSLPFETGESPIN